MERLKQIEATSNQRFKIQNLRKLITGHYGLKMFDVAEQSKRDLSSRRIARLDFEGENFRVFDSITRREFERLIRSDVKAISQRIDEVLRKAGLNDDDIDAVIRTGGSSQIPLFVDMLQERFGAENVRDIDAFGSVTSGLGVIGYHIERGNSDLEAYHAADYRGRRSIREEKRSAVPTVDLDVVKRVVDVQERGGATQATRSVLLYRDHEQRLCAVYLDAAHATLDVADLPKPLDAAGFALVAASDAKVVLLTTDYRCYVKLAGDLADLYQNGLYIEDLEGFRRDDFSNETIYNVMLWSDVVDYDFVTIISSLGYTQKFFGARLAEKMDRPAPYQIERKRGYPAFLRGANADDYLVAITHAGRAARIKADNLPLGNQRLISLPMSGQIIGMVAGQPEQDLLLVTRSGYAKRLQLRDVPIVKEMTTNGSKIMQRTSPIAALPYAPEQDYWLMTGQRLLPIDADSVPLLGTDKTDHKVIKPKRSEQLLSVLTRLL